MDNQTTSRSFKYASKYSAAVVVLSFTTVSCGSCICNKEKTNSEIESIKSHHRHYKRKKFSAGVLPEVFLLYSMAILFLLAAAFLFTITIWSFLRKMFVYTYFMEVKMDTTFFTIPAGTLCLPMVVLTILLKSHKLKYMLTFLVLQTISISLLFAGNFVGMIYQLDYSNETVRLSSTLPREALNNTLYHLISAYERSDGNNHSAVDKIQIKFRCCGIDGKNDFSDVPESCCPELNCKEHNVWPKGCLRSIQEDVAWHKQITASLTQLFLLMCFFDLAMVSSVFLSDHYKWKSVRKKIRKTAITQGG